MLGPASTPRSSGRSSVSLCSPYNETVIPRGTWSIRLRGGCNWHGENVVSVFVKTSLLARPCLRLVNGRRASICLCPITLDSFIACLPRIYDSKDAPSTVAFGYTSKNKIYQLYVKLTEKRPSAATSFHVCHVESWIVDRSIDTKCAGRSIRDKWIETRK